MRAVLAGRAEQVRRAVIDESTITNERAEDQMRVPPPASEP